MNALPPGRHFAITWSIPDEFGGMTTALLQRSRAFVRLAEVTVDILTFDLRDDYPRREAMLRERGELIDGMHLFNLYEWLRHAPLPGGALRLDRHVFTPLERDAGTPDRRGVRSRTRTAPDGTVLQVDHYRDDGTLVVTDRRDVRVRGELGGRSIVLCDEAGEPVRSWGRIHHLYRAWLNRLTAGDRANMIIDSKTIAPFMLDYRRPGVTTVHVVHNSHVDRAGVRASRREVFERLDDFDAVVLLTRRQRDDVRAMFGRTGRLHVIPNAVRELPPGDDDRDPTRGIVLSSLTRRKRVDQAMRAAHAAAARLDVYGDGELRERLAELESQLHGVHLRGYRVDATLELANASFLVATGSSEGFPLSLIEAMASGCIPIAYDVPYGPSDLIDGVNGLIVPSGDVDALAEAIRLLMTETPEQLAERRRHARATAARYTDEVITRRWARVLASATRRHRRGYVVRRVRDGARAALRAS